MLGVSGENCFVVSHQHCALKILSADILYKMCYTGQVLVRYKLSGLYARLLLTEPCVCVCVCVVFRFDLFLPLYDLWRQYITELLSLKSSR